MEVFDMITKDGDLEIRQGDFFVDESTYQHIEDILIADKGTYKQFPQLGANIRSRLLGQIDNGYKREIKLNLETDGMRVDEVSYKNGELIVKAQYE